MPQIVFSLAAALIAFSAAYSVYPKLFGRDNSALSGVSLEKTIRDIKAELTEISATPGETAGLVLADVQIELMTQAEREKNGEGKLTVPVFDEVSVTAGDAEKLTEGSKITVVFTAPKGSELLGGNTGSNLDLSELVLAARQALLATIAEKPALIPKSVNIEVSFQLVKSRSSDVGVKAYVVELGTSEKHVRTAGNKVVLKYKNPAFANEKKETTPTPP